MFQRNPDNTVTFTCNYCNKVIGNDDNVTMFYRMNHYHPNCFARGVEAYKANEIQPRKDFVLPAIKPIDLSKPFGTPDQVEP